MDKPFLMQVCTLSWSEYLGRIGCGRILQGTLKKGDKILRTHTRWKDYEQTDWEVVSTDTSTCTHLYVTKGLDRAEVEEAGAGDIVWFTGPANIDLGDTMSSPETPDAVMAAARHRGADRVDVLHRQHEPLREPGRATRLLCASSRRASSARPRPTPRCAWRTSAAPTA